MASVDPATQTGASKKSDWYLSLLRLSETLTVVVLLVLVFAFTSARMPSYVSLTNIQNMLVQASIMAVTAYGMTLAIAMRGFDLSGGIRNVPVVLGHCRPSSDNQRLSRGARAWLWASGLDSSTVRR